LLAGYGDATRKRSISSPVRSKRDDNGDATERKRGGDFFAKAGKSPFPHPYIGIS
jgi:hypothetical protein